MKTKKEIIEQYPQLMALDSTELFAIDACMESYRNQSLAPISEMEKEEEQMKNDQHYLDLGISIGKHKFNWGQFIEGFIIGGIIENVLKAMFILTLIKY
jgi:hypothetical protein